MLSCSIGNYLIKRQSERHIAIVIIVIVSSTFALKTGQLKQAFRFGGSLTQAVKKPYDVPCLAGNVFKGVQ